MTLEVPGSTAARRIRAFFSDCSYNEQTLVRELGQASPLLLTAGEQQQASSQLSVAPATRILIELFFLESPVDSRRCSELLPAGVHKDLLQTGLIVDGGETVSASALLVPVGELLIAGDRYARLPSEAPVEHVLSVNPPARLLANFAVRRKVSRLLDLCTGNGIHALALAGHADEVVATDLNPRALQFAIFNAALNGIENIEARLGAGFEPVKGERFDQVVCNPPYIVTPSRRFMCTDNNMELDGFCQSLLRQSPAYLSEGGLLQMICEWVELDGEDWRARLSQWFSGNGCDAWVICSGYSSIEDYVTRRSQQTLAEPEVPDMAMAREWLEYFRQRRVTGVRSGFIQLRRRHGENWRSFTSLGNRAPGSVGESIASGFRDRDRYLRLDDAQILPLLPVPATGVRELPAEAAAPGAVRLLKGEGLPVSFLASAAVRSMLCEMDGKRDVRSVCDAAAQAAGIPANDVRSECCSVVRELLSQGLLRIL